MPLGLLVARAGVEEGHNASVFLKLRGVTEDDLVGKPAEFAMPTQLVQLAFEADRSFTCSARSAGQRGHWVSTAVSTTSAASPA